MNNTSKVITPAQEQPHEQPVEEPIVDPHVQVLHEDQEANLRRSNRQKKSAIPSDYVVYLSGEDMGQGIDDPVTFSQAINCVNSDSWLQAMKEELVSMDCNQVWELIQLPLEKKPVGCK